ncbi:hypothetical protein [Sneathiella sp.]|uniref:hypothetical protein n=1 Tax=Sneathiella sp. TaxID=1964365 RepID=UPI002618EA34|nr:hypothetical protein [Sneathiella sp.]
MSIGNIEKSRPIWERYAIVLTIAGAVIGSIIGFFVADFSSFRSDNKTEISARYEKAKETAIDAFQKLQPFADVAVGKKPEYTTRQVEDLQKTLKALFSYAQKVADDVPGLKPEYDRYSNAITSLNDAINRFLNPGDAKKFVEATSEFFDAQEKFDEKYSQLTKSYFLSWVD